MKKVMKLVLCAAITILAASCSSFVEDDFEDEAKLVEARAVSSIVTYTQSNEIFDLVCQGYNEGVKGPVSITKGTLVKGSSSKSVYLVALSGTEMVKNQSTGYITDLLSGFNLKNPYVENVVKIINETLPKNSNIVIAGHSLGGMIAQQVAADKSVKSGYNVLNTVTFGSPLLSAGEREGDVKRLGDTSDVIPYASGSTINNTIWAIAGLNRENGGYGTNLLEAHTQSYGRSDVWGKYDVTGTKKGNAKLVLDLNTQKFYHSDSWF